MWSVCSCRTCQEATIFPLLGVNRVSPLIETLGGSGMTVGIGEGEEEEEEEEIVAHEDGDMKTVVMVQEQLAGDARGHEEEMVAVAIGQEEEEEEEREVGGATAEELVVVDGVWLEVEVMGGGDVEVAVDD